MPRRRHTPCRAHFALVAAASLALAAPAWAQPATPGAPQREVAAPSGSLMEQRGQQQSDVSADQLRTVEQSLRQTGDQLANTPAGELPNIDRARTAVVSGQSVLARIPENQRRAAEFEAAQNHLAAARRELEAPRLNQTEAVNRVREAAEAVAILSRGLGGPTGATQAVGR